MDKKIKILERELRYLKKEVIIEEIENNKTGLDYKNVNIKSLAKDIYERRGIDYSKLKTNIFSVFINEFSLALDGIKNKSLNIKRKMIFDLLTLILIVVLIKIPFDLVRDIGYEYLEMLSINNTLYTLWNLAFLIIYTITLICTAIVLIKNFNSKYVNNK